MLEIISIKLDSSGNITFRCQLLKKLIAKYLQCAHKFIRMQRYLLNEFFNTIFHKKLLLYETFDTEKLFSH